MNEKQCNQWLSNADGCTQQNVKLSIPSIENIFDTSMSTVKTDVHILPLSLENNATLTGTSVILDQFAEEFSLCNKVDKLETLPFDKRNRNFSLKKAREHVEFLIMLYEHRDEMADLLKTLEATEKEFDSSQELTTNDALEKFRLHFSRCANCEVAPLRIKTNCFFIGSSNESANAQLR